jgi:GNAT superfamily N-acetyltransferase
MDRAGRATQVERVILGDGSVVHVRPIEPSDKQLLQAAFEGLGEESRYRRFLHPVKWLSEHELAYFTEVDHYDHEALLAVGPHGTEPVGVARYVRLPEPEVAEVAIAVVDDWHGRGVGTLLLQELVGRARAAGICRFRATCLADNAEVLDLLGRLGTTRVDHPEPGLAELDIDLPTAGMTVDELHAALRHAAAGAVQVQPPGRPSPDDRKVSAVSTKSFSDEDARRVGEAIGIDWASAPFDVEQFRIGMEVELEHGLHDPATNVTDDDPLVTGKIALAHLNEFADYYDRLQRMEADAESDAG